MVDCNRGASCVYISTNSKNSSNYNTFKLTPMKPPTSIIAPGHQPITEKIETEAAKHKPTEYSNNDDVMYIYSTTANRAKAKQNDKNKATFFIRALSKAFIDERIFGKHDFKKILYCTNSIFQQLISADGADSVKGREGQVMQVESTMTRHLYLA